MKLAMWAGQTARPHTQAEFLEWLTNLADAAVRMSFSLRQGNRATIGVYELVRVVLGEEWVKEFRSMGVPRDAWLNPDPRLKRKSTEDEKIVLFFHQR